MITKKESKQAITVHVELGINTLLFLLFIPLLCLKIVGVLNQPWAIVLIPLAVMFVLGFVQILVRGIEWMLKNTFYFSKGK